MKVIQKIQENLKKKKQNNFYPEYFSINVSFALPEIGL